ncbi:MAG: acylneuraminate cytidylyltransferase family protein, partial [Halomonadaceae bacterium]
MPQVYGFIPARAGSSRLPDKNRLPFHGRPLYEWTVELARKSGVFDRLFLSTDIAQIHDQYASDPIV